MVRRYTPTTGSGSPATRASTSSATKSLRVRFASTTAPMTFCGTSA